MQKRIYVNNFAATLSNAAATGDTTLALTSAAGLSLSANQYAILTLGKFDSSGNMTAFELVKATAVSGNSVTVARAQEGTTALTWASGDSVQITTTRDSLMLTQGRLLGSFAEKTYAATIGGAYSVVRDNGGIQELTLNANTTLSLDLADGESLTLTVILGTYALTLPTGISWLGGAAPTWGAKGMATLWAVGSTIRGVYAGTF